MRSSSLLITCQYQFNSLSVILLEALATLVDPQMYSFIPDRGDRGWLSHGLVVTLPISHSLDDGTLWGFTRDMRIAD